MNADDVLRAKLLTDFLFFVRWFHFKTTGQKFIVKPFHTRLTDTLTTVARGETPRLIINIPPRYGKTQLAVIYFIAWAIANNPRARFIHTSYSDDLVLENASAVRELIRGEEFQRLFPTELRRDSDSKKKWYTMGGGGMYSVASGGAITGFGAGQLQRTRTGTGSPADGFGGAIIVDDPVKPDDVFSEAVRNRINRRHNNTLASRLNSPETPIIVIMQRLHEDDYSGHLLGGGSGEDWTHLVIPAREETGTPIWPEKHSSADLARMEKADNYTFAGQYMQRPAPLGGGIFKDAWWDYYDAMPPMLWHGIWADTAQKTGEKNDYSVFACWGRSANGQAVLLDLLRGKWEAPELLTNARAFWNKHKGRHFKIEDKVSGTGLIQQMRREGIPVVPIQREKDKYTRALDVAPLCQSGNVLLPRNAPWLSTWLSEHSAFPNATWDDQVDTTIDAIGDILDNGVPDYGTLL